MAAIDYILERLSEPSTYKGLLVTISATTWGAHIDPAISQTVIAICAALFAGIEIFRKEPKNKD